MNVHVHKHAHVPTCTTAYLRVQRDYCQDEATDRHTVDAALSSFGSVDLPSLVDGDSFVGGERSKVVTSRLGGRKSGQAVSRSGSVMSNATDDIGKYR